MQGLIDHLRAAAGQVSEPNARAMFEVSVEVLSSLVKAFDLYEKRSVSAWNASASARN